MGNKPVSFEEWERSVHTSIKNDPLWDFLVYPKSLFLYDLMWEDCEYLLPDERGRAISRQLTRSVGSISANIEEGYGRGYGADYAYRLRIALGEARESRGWYWKGHKRLPLEVLNHRITLLDEIIAILPTIIQRQRQFKKR
ncbi:MAG: four helix bundle protein [Chloroflexi bacterium]|nr:four helix bundle protein [Chloroflexota bacterium]